MSDDYYDEYYDDDRIWPMWALGVGALVVAAVGVWFAIGAVTGGDESADSAVPVAAEADDTAGTQPTTTEDATTPTDSADPTDPATATDTVSESTDVTTTTSVGDESTEYATLPDGSPVPVLAIFDDDLITLSGAVPSGDAAERLRLLALANNTSPGAQVASFLTIDPEVPVGVGVRMIEVNAAQFEEGSPTIPLDYVAQLDRVAALMASLPDVTVDVIGHTDQTGDDDVNFQLSTDRARASADYLISQGIEPTRVSARGAGSSDLLTLNNDEVSLALNRRTEFVFFGLLVDDA